MKKGFTLIELLAVIVILAIISAIAVPLVLGIIKDSTKKAMAVDADVIFGAIDQKKVMNFDFDPTAYSDNVTGLLEQIRIRSSNYNNITLVTHDNKLYVAIDGKDKYEGLMACGSVHNIRVVEGTCELDFIPPTVTLNGDTEIRLEQGDTYTDPGVTATDNSTGSLTTVTTGTVNTSTTGTTTITYTVTDESGNTTTETRTVIVEPSAYDGPRYRSSKGVNGPVLAAGMTPIKWNGSAWVDTNKNDVNWYNYGTTSGTRNWANVRTSDGSMWVWIPRYAYQIATNYHTANVGTINIKFIQGTATDTTSDGTSIALTPTYSGNGQTNYVKGPAFTFGTTELTGIWVSKFEMSGTSTTLASKPSVVSYRNLTLANAFTYTRNMETLGIYGWATASGLNADGTFTTNTNNVDTHVIKNIEWGAVTYLTQSTYGKNAEVWINPSNNCTTGCAGAGPSEYFQEGCPNYYNSANGQQASTTGNIYGIYDMSGGSWEYVMANYNNLAGTSGLTPSVIADKYIDRYTGTGYDNTKFGDAVWETSSTATSQAWYTGFSDKVDTSFPWYSRGMSWIHSSTADVFAYFNGNISGASSTDHSWHTIIAVGTGL